TFRAERRAFPAQPWLPCPAGRGGGPFVGVFIHPLPTPLNFSLDFSPFVLIKSQTFLFCCFARSLRSRLSNPPKAPPPVVPTATRRAPALTTELCPYEVAIGLGTFAVIANFRQWTVSLGQAAEVCRHTDGRGGVGDHVLVVNYAYDIRKLFCQDIYHLMIPDD